MIPSQKRRTLFHFTIAYRLPRIHVASPIDISVLFANQQDSVCRPGSRIVMAPNSLNVYRDVYRVPKLRELCWPSKNILGCQSTLLKASSSPAAGFAMAEWLGKLLSRTFRLFGKGSFTRQPRRCLVK